MAAALVDASSELLLNQATHDQLPAEAQGPFVLQWLLRLQAAATPDHKEALKSQQDALFGQLLLHGSGSCSPPVRKHVAASMAALLNVCGTLKLAPTVNDLVDRLRAKDEGAPALLVQKRAAAAILGGLCRRLGRTVCSAAAQPASQHTHTHTPLLTPHSSAVIPRSSTHAHVHHLADLTSARLCHEHKLQPWFTLPVPKLFLLCPSAPTVWVTHFM